MKEVTKAKAFDKSFLLRILIMSNISLMLVLCSFISVTAAESYAQRVKISLEYKNVPLERVITDIREQTEFEFAYQADLESLILKKVSVNVKDELIENVMNTVLKGTGLNFRIIDKIILLSKNQILTTSPGSTYNMLDVPVSGEVKDKSGTLPGVTIRVKGTNLGTVTDAAGKYKLNVPDKDAILIFSYVGYQTVEIPLQGRLVIDVEMVNDALNLNEIIVVGYGTQKKRDITGAVSTISSSDIQKIPVVGVDHAIQGQAAGVQVTQNYGTPGAGVQVRIRGIGTIGDSDPLYVIDGVPTKENLNSLNASDIESISILKDASAAAIYGARAANGVVLITTKKGQVGVSQVQFNATYGIQKISNKLQLLSADEYAMVMDEALTNDGLSPVWNNPGLGIGTDWQDAIFRNAAFQKYDFSVSSGNDKTTYLLGLGYLGQDGIVEHSDFERYNLRFNISSDVTDKFTDRKSVV